MRMVRRALDNVRPSFTEGGRFAKFKPVFMALDFFLFSPGSAPSVAPYVRDPLDVKRYMSMVIVALFPAVVASVYFFGLRVLAMIVVSYAAGGLVEVLFAIVRKEEINEGFLVTGLIFPLVLPPALPLWMVAAGIGFGVLFGKELFGGTGRNLFNPALVGRCFLAIGYPAAMTTGWITPGSGPSGRLFQYVHGATVDALSGATPLVGAKQGALAGLRELFTGAVAGSSGETSAALIVLGGTLLLLTRVANWRTVTGLVGAAFVLETVLHLIDPQAFAPALWHLAAGGLLFGAFFMATDPVTSPATNSGKWVYGILIGSATILIRNLTGYVEGVMFAILLGNIVAPVLDTIANRVHLRRLVYER